MCGMWCGVAGCSICYNVMYEMWLGVMYEMVWLARYVMRCGVTGGVVSMWCGWVWCEV